MPSIAPSPTDAEVEPSRATVSAASRTAIPLWGAVALSAVGGLALDMATPSLGWWPLTFVSVILALLALRDRTIPGALLVSAVFGGLFYFTHLLWVGEFLGPIPWAALAGLETVLFAVGAVPITFAYRWTSHAPRHSLVHLVAVPAVIAGLWTTRETVMGAWPYSGFPWARLGMTQVNGPFAEVASWTGVTGLTFLIVFVCATAAQAIRAGTAWRIVGVVPAAAVTGVLFIAPQFPTTDAGSMRVGWVQGNGPSAYFDDRSLGDVIDAQEAATAPLLGQTMDLLVWPEGSIDIDPLADPATAARLDRLTADAGAPLLANAATDRGTETFNTSMLWTGVPGEKQLHDKVNPVPFGEYVPDRWFYEALVPDLVGLIQREYTPGSNAPFMTVDGVGIGLAICFDVIYDNVIWDGARNGAQFYAFQTNNADFRGTDENLQQLAFARMRAIETGRAVVNVSTVGTSQVIAPDGSTLASIDVNTAGARITDVPLRTGLTPASVVGPWTAPAVAIATIIAVGVLAVRSRCHCRPATVGENASATSATARTDASETPMSLDLT